MATVIFQAVGSAIGGPIGGMIGAVIGGVIDAQLFGPGDQEGPRLQDLKVSPGSYGYPIPLLYGPTVRTSGVIIWTTDLLETKEEEEQGKGGGPTVTSYSYRLSCAIAISNRACAGLNKIWANGKVIYDASGAQQSTGSPTFVLPAVDPVEGLTVSKTNGTDFTGTMQVMSQITFYPGNSTQQPDPVIESFEGVGNVPGYRNTSYIVIKDLQLADFGNRMPNFEFEVIADTSLKVAQAVHDIVDRAGIVNSSVFGLTDEIKGYAINRQTPVFRAILPLGVAYNFETTEQRGQIRFVKRSLGMKGTIPIESMNARVPGATGGDKSPIEYRNISEVGMPDQVSITYLDPEMDYQINTQRVNRRQGNAINKIEQELPMVLSADEARRIADRLLWGAWSNRRAASNRLSDEFARLNPGDIVGIPTFDETLPMRIIRTTRGNNGITELEYTYEDPEVFNSQISGAAGPARNATVTIPPATIWVPMDAPLLQDTDDQSGFYWAATSDSSGWRGTNIRRSTDGGTTYSSMATSAVQNPVGDVVGTLGDGPTVVFDNINTLTVTLTSQGDTLESVSELLVLNGQNAAWVGPSDGGEGEIIQFQNATLISENTYELTKLLRGRLGTEHATATHGAGEVFVLLQSSTLGRSAFGVSDWDKERSYKPVSILSTEDATPEQTFTNTGVRAKPLSPVHVEGARDASNNLTITWLRRSRFRQPGLGGGTLPLGETTEAYEVDILQGSTVLRTISVTSESATYTAAQQTSDGLTPGNLVEVAVYQISSERGRGYPASATI